MKIIENTTKFQIEESTAVAIGKFDGFHLGHQKLLRQLEIQKSKGQKSVVFTFVPSPAAFFSGAPIQELSTVEEKRRIFAQAGVDYLVEFPFVQSIADMEPEVFVEDVLVGMLHAKCVVAGDDVSYGRHGAGNCKLLEEMAKKYLYDVVIIDKVLYNDNEVSSTFVRKAVKEGDMELVSVLLGTPYHVSGEIIHGKKLGRTLGMPTVNLLPPEEKLLPPKGVYYSYVYLYSGKGSQSYESMPYHGVQLPSITNIGTKPTVNDQKRMGVETYIYDFNADVYGKYMDVYLLAYKRPEMRFEGVDNLKTQMQADIAAGRQYHGI
ncbi:MAG: bifunctional riboflavin kinase/FAD synthetase [Lachnospiraceae bacterium]|nr:bifunctional riboflavin kinase/FAD synthetase [Lachnospiraceae bacterium]